VDDVSGPWAAHVEIHEWCVAAPRQQYARRTAELAPEIVPVCVGAGFRGFADEALQRAK
jgi:hypothetical protein